jgi:8-oxo-dGTP pyrophosphatase MutT (NUDIX family)
MRNPWKTLASRIVYENPWLRVREDKVIRPDGGEGIYGVVEIRPSVGVVALDSRNQIVLVGQWRYTFDRYTWEIPRGGSAQGETDLLAVAQRELAEETGVAADTWQAIGSVDVCNGVTTDVQHLFLATELRAVEAHQDAVEEIEVRREPLERAVQMVMRGEITEVCSVAAILKVARLL